MTLASVDPLPGIDWSARAALGDAMSEVEDDTPILILTQDKEGQNRVRSANGTMGLFHWMLSLEANRILDKCK